MPSTIIRLSVPIFFVALLAGIHVLGLPVPRQTNPQLENADRPDLIIQTGHNGRVSSYAFSPDGDLFASGSEDNTVILRDAATGYQLRTFRGHKDAVADVVFSRDGRILASVSNGKDGSICLWDVKSGELRKKIPAEGGIHELVFGAADSVLIGLNHESFANDEGSTYTYKMHRIGRVHFWDSGTGKKLSLGGGIADAIASSPTEPLIALAEKFLPQFEIFQASYEPGQGPFSPSPFKRPAFFPKIKIIDIKSQKVLHTLKGHDDKINALAFSPNGKLLVSASQDGKIKFWNRLTGKLVLATPAMTSEPYSVMFSPDSLTVYYVRRDGSIAAIKADSGATTVILKADGNILMSPGARSIMVSTKDSLELWSPGGNTPAWSARHGRETIKATALDSSGSRIAVGKASGVVHLWRPHRSRHPVKFAGTNGFSSLAFGPAGDSLLGGDSGGGVKKWSALPGERPAEYKCARTGVPFTFDAQGRLLSVEPFPDDKPGPHDFGDFRRRERLGGKREKWGYPEIEVWDSATCAEVKLPTARALVNAFPNGKCAVNTADLLACAGAAYNIPVIMWGGPEYTYRWFDYHFTEIDYPLRLIRLSDGKVVNTVVGQTFGLTGPYEVDPGGVGTVAFNAVGELLAVGGGHSTKGHVDVWEVGSGKLRKRLEDHFRVRAVSFNPRNEIELAVADESPDIKVWNVKSGKSQVLRGHTDAVSSVAFSRDGRLIVSSSDDNTTKVWDAEKGTELASIVSIGEDKWFVSTPAGLFDTNSIESAPVHWVMKDDPLKALPVDIFVRDYFEPDLLKRVLRSVFKGEPLRTVPPLAGLNRAQPTVKVIDAQPEPNKQDEVYVTVEVANGSVSYVRDGREFRKDSGAYDLRLFRDGKMVAQYPGSGAVQTATANNPDESEAWRDTNRITLDPKSGTFVHTFHNIKLPHCRSDGRVEFTAYAFNEDRVKSQTAHGLPYQLDKRPPSPCRRAYLITVGVGANQSGLNLAFAANSATSVSSALADSLHGEYEVVKVQLLSMLEPNGPRAILKQATAQNIRAVFDVLAGRKDRAEGLEKHDGVRDLRAATPDDLVLLFISSHGYADPQGNFYVVPYDTGPPSWVTGTVLNKCLSRPDGSARCEDAKRFLERTISSDDLAGWWHGVDAGEMVMILDSCYSAAVPGRDFRPGPLGDRGLGQLAYDKGMVILTAAQPDKEAFAALRVGDGRSLLANVLVGTLSLNPGKSLPAYLREAEARVPEHYRVLYPSVQEEDVQSPVLLDFATKK